MVTIRRLIFAFGILLALAACGGEEAAADSAVATLADQPAPTATASNDADSADDDAVGDSGTTESAASIDAEPAEAEEAEAGASEEPEEPEELDTEEQLLRFTECMRDEGVDMNDPEVDADGNAQMPTPVNPQFGNSEFTESLQAAADACNEFLDGVDIVAAGFDVTELQDQVLQFTGCMRDNGYDMPDIEIGGVGAPPDIDPTAPDWIAAFDVCGDLLAGIAPGGGAGQG